MRILSVTIAALVIFLFSGDYMRLGGLSFRILALVSTGIFLLGSWSRISLWCRGSGKLQGGDLLREALAGTFSKDCFLALRLFEKSRVRGIVLALTIWSFVVLTLGSVSLSLEYTLRTDLTSGSGFSFLMDLSGFILFLCILFYLVRRIAVRRASAIAVMDDAVVLLFFLFIILSGFATEGLRIAYGGVSSDTASPVGAAVAEIFLSFSDSPPVLLKIKDFLWKLHALLVFFFFAYIPFSKQFHMFAAQIVTRDAERRKKELWRILHE